MKLPKHDVIASEEGAGQHDLCVASGSASLSLCQLPSLSAALSVAWTLSAKERSIEKHGPMRGDTWTACYCHEEGSLPGSLLSRCNIATATRCNSRKITAALDEHSQAVVNLLASTATPDLIMRIMQIHISFAHN